MKRARTSPPLAFHYRHHAFGRSLLVHADCFDWLQHVSDDSIDAVVTDPPFGVKEFEVEEIERMHAGGTGIWRIPPAFDGNVRAPLPRFTALEPHERETLQRFFREWTNFLLPKL